jgi:hypothetical protein
MMAGQVPTRGTTAKAIMRTAAFLAGVDDVRNGRPPNYETFNFSAGEDDLDAKEKINAHWNYERGRQWASLAPRSMLVKVDGALNPKAIALYEAARNRGYIAR